ncbi:MAG: hypothetical protein ACI9CF_001322 [Candidatus Omnitrophota bacterium]|jgi:hypothetical protein
MKDFKWNPTKSIRLKKSRGVSFEDIIKSELVDILEHPRRPEQMYMLFLHKKYIWVVPAVEESDYIFFKTLYASRKYTKKYKENNS